MKKITIIGNSVALRVRPPEKKGGKVYSTLLEEKLNYNTTQKWIITNLALGRWLSSEFFEKSDAYLSTFPNIFILNIGCVDAPNREIPLWFANKILSRKREKYSKIFSLFYIKFIKNKFRTKLVLFRNKKSWTNKNDFKNNIQNIIKLIYKDTNADIIIIGINKGNDRIDNILPGTSQKYKEYNYILKKICINKSIPFIDPEHLKSETYFPDGVHYNKIGHELISEKLYKTIILNG